ncbi:unnamed protein product [Polarella glacialis]|uniref:Serine-tRNA synthetase type1 N-terminal domain-containing protein n=1 Tax=Polarella glacialis TaxID=89957 RepID=A0A813KTF6_POLGL|nr:unnamed protein product [Polarella glacialis]
MPVDAKALRDRPDDFRDSERRRFRDAAAVDRALEADASWRAATTAINALRAELGSLQKAISEKKRNSKGKDACEEELAEKSRLEAAQGEAEARAAETLSDRDSSLGELGNLVHLSVPVAENDDGNSIVTSWGSPGEKPRVAPAIPHEELFRRLGACEMERGVRVAGRRGYFLRGPGVVLNMALQNYGVSFLARRGYVPLQPPYFMRREVMARTAELRDFDDQLYSVTSRPQQASSSGSGSGEQQPPWRVIVVFFSKKSVNSNSHSTKIKNIELLTIFSICFCICF